MTHETDSRLMTLLENGCILYKNHGIIEHTVAPEHGTVKLKCQNGHITYEEVTHGRQLKKYTD